MKKTYELKNWQFRIKHLNPLSVGDFENANSVHRDFVLRADPFTAAEYDREYEVDKEVTLPHTWNVDSDERLQNYRGIGCYETTVTIRNPVDYDAAFLYVGAAYHTANIYVNGHPAFYHSGSGYLPFEAEISEYLKEGENQIRIDVDNTPKKEMLPHVLDFDWADDGGLTRDVRLTLYEEKDIFDADIRYEIEIIDGNLCSGSLFIEPDTTDQKLSVELIDYQSKETVLSCLTEDAEAFELVFEDLSLWQPDRPNLYTVRIRGENDTFEKRIGFRTIEVNGTTVLLNGKPVYLKGCEWMPGSHPDYGMAETPEISRIFLRKIREAGCIFTRFHWQQDDSIFDWCDEHGLMVQEEIPYWGYPKIATPLQTDLAENQAIDMVHYHGHHPSIICWGAGNELGGPDPETIDYVDHMVDFFKTLDDSRLVNYVSNSVGLDQNLDRDDAALHGDIAMWNDYLALWQPCDDVEAVIRRTAEKAGNMPILVSEFGLCEPRFSGGDEKRCEILQERLPIYAAVDNMCGYMYFCLNDYRTQMGEEGDGRFRRRVHGSVDMYGEEKPSYQLFRKLQEKYGKQF
ncbi:MAG: hypothetical protein IKS18_08755 [Lachnospiraceae bacterium]|nr:hypothetical protein [Lachnospiraceae bacterium]